MRRLILFICCSLFLTTCWGNNVQLNNAQLVDDQTIIIDLEWENAWNLPDSIEPYNHDAVWIFVKYRVNGEAWEHLLLGNTISDTSADGMLSQRIAQDKTGLIVHPARVMGGTISSSLEIPLDQVLSDGDYDFRIYGIEMVHVSPGPFWLGDSTSLGSLGDGQSGLPYQVSDESTISVGVGAQMLNGPTGHAPFEDIPASFPKGTEGFYAMKHEISQVQYMDFLNTLSYVQQTERTAVLPSSNVGVPALAGFGNPYRNGIVISNSGDATSDLPAIYAMDANENGVMNEVDDGADRACNFLTWSDLAAYLDWAALRPMTELEFEKICKGPEPSKFGEYAWGTDMVSDAENVIYDGTASESVTDAIALGSGIANHGNFNPNGLAVLRNGFAGTDSSNRNTIGAGYYGALELSGNLWEQVINLSEDGLSFTGQHGDGQLSMIGNSNEEEWCPESGSCAGLKGGAYQSAIFDPYRDLAVADRYYIYFQGMNNRRPTSGGRGVRKL